MRKVKRERFATAARRIAAAESNKLHIESENAKWFVMRGSRILYECDSEAEAESMAQSCVLGG